MADAARTREIIGDVNNVGGFSRERQLVTRLV